MHEKAKFVCFNYMQPRKVKFKSVQINMKQVSYMGCSSETDLVNIILAVIFKELYKSYYILLPYVLYFIHF